MNHINTEEMNARNISTMIQKSRQEFEQSGKRDMEVALAESMKMFEKQIKQQEESLMQETLASQNQYEEE
jgi:hypothetical protein